MGTEKLKNSIGDQVTKNWLTKDEFADELGISKSGFNLQVHNKEWCKKKGVPYPGAQHMQTRGRQNVYSPAYVDLIKKAKEGSARKTKGSSKSSMKHAVLKVTVPIFDQQIASLLQKKFPTESAMTKFLQEKLTETVKGSLSRIEELKRKHAQEMQEALSNL